MYKNIFYKFYKKNNLKKKLVLVLKKKIVKIYLKSNENEI